MSLGGKLQHVVRTFWSDKWDRIVNSGFLDTKLEHLIHKVQQQPHKHSKYTWDDTILKRKGKIIIGTKCQGCFIGRDSLGM